jgi:hypothetical protein
MGFGVRVGGANICAIAIVMCICAACVMSNVVECRISNRNVSVSGESDGALGGAVRPPEVSDLHFVSV